MKSVWLIGHVPNAIFIVILVRDIGMVQFQPIKIEFEIIRYDFGESCANNRSIKGVYLYINSKWKFNRFTCSKNIVIMWNFRFFFSLEIIMEHWIFWISFLICINLVRVQSIMLKIFNYSHNVIQIRDLVYNFVIVLIYIRWLMNVVFTVKLTSPRSFAKKTKTKNENAQAHAALSSVCLFCLYSSVIFSLEFIVCARHFKRS